MYCVLADPGDPVGDADPIPVYRVRIWSPPPSPRLAWLVDEWSVNDAGQVTDVIRWATETALENPFEVFLRWEEQHTSVAGVSSSRARYARVFGNPPRADVAVTKTLRFESE